FLMQSSSASTSMLVSLVSARMMSLQQALLLIPGAAIGTTLTVQLISFNILMYSLPLIAIGFFISVISRNRRTNALGKMIMGFGLIFFGMKVMSETVIPLKSLPFFINAMTTLSGNRFWALIFSALFTIIIQSSGATLGIVIALAHQGVIDLRGAIPIIFGANVGTCITAILASMGTTREAKRVAWAHFLYKLLGVVLFYPFITYLALLVEWLTRLLGMIPGLSDVSVARQVANADTLYNVIVALLFIPFVKQFEMLTRQFLPQKLEETQEVRPKYLELQIMDSPVIAIGSVMREISRMGRFVQEQMKAAAKVIFERKESEIDFIIQRDDKVDQLHHSITCYLANLTQKNLSEDELQKSIGLLYIVTDLENIGDLIVKNLMPLGRKIINNDLHFSAEGEAELKELYKQVEEDLARVVISCSTWDKKLALEVMEHRELMKHLGQELMLKHLARLQEERKDTLETSSVHLDVINYLLRLEFHLYHIAGVVAGRIELRPKEGQNQHLEETNDIE
ncbi:MAG: Na/Pi cotransporter family protein, partial [Candidatus Sumerlaeia bacterium]|nr:Na/Pi cotransporter family protein [Candidatus Sumerlaeia bacterium]